METSLTKMEMRLSMAEDEIKWLSPRPSAFKAPASKPKAPANKPTVLVNKPTPAVKEGTH
jgi:hypothetical protein